MLVEPETVYASGMPVGIYAKTKGVITFDREWGSGEGRWTGGKAVRKSCKSGDYIVSVNGMAVSEKEDLAAAVNEAGGGKDILGIMRGEEYIEVSLDPVKSVSGKIYAWCLGEGRPCGSRNTYLLQSRWNLCSTWTCSE